MQSGDSAAILPPLRGALLRFVPAVTLCEATDATARPDLNLQVWTDAAAGSDAAGPVSELQAYVEEHGSVPRTIRVADGPLLAVGSTLSEPAARSGEPLIEGLRGRDDVVQGRVAVVTGGAQGFGEQIVRSLVGHGARVFIADLNLDGAATLADELNAEHGEVTRGVEVDVSNESSVAAMFDEVTRRAGGVDLLVSNAGVLKAGSVKELSSADFEFVTRVNYTGFFLCTRFGARIMARQNRLAPPTRSVDIVQINSKSGLAGSNKNGAYAGSKFGSLGLVQSFALELVSDHIKVNAICPGNFFDGPLWSDPDRGLFVQYLQAGKVPGAASIADVKAHYESQVPMGRGCRGEDVVRALLYVIEQQYETGQAVPVTGGQIMLS